MSAGSGGAGSMGAGSAGGAGQPVFDPGDGVASPQGTELSKQASHVAQGLALLIEQFKHKPRIAALLRGWLQQVQELECVFLEDLLLERAVDTAVGEQLDGLGAIVGEERGGRSDDEYRIAISSRILVNNSSGRIEEMITITKAALKPGDPGPAVEIVEYPPASFEIRVLEEVLTIDIAAAFAFIKLAVAAGVRPFLVFKESDDTFRFASGSVVTTDPDHGFGAGALTGVLD